MAWQAILSFRARDYFHRRAVMYVLVVILFVSGTVFGAMAVNVLSPAQKADLEGYLEAFFQSLTADHTLSRVQVMQDALFTNVVRTVGLIWLLGLSLLGLPLILFIVFTRGFVLGFTVGFLVKHLAYRGILVALVAVLPHNLLAIPSLVVASVAGISFGLDFLRGRFSAGAREVWPEFLGYTVLGLLCVGVMALASVVEAYLTPSLLQTLAGWVI